MDTEAFKNHVAHTVCQVLHCNVMMKRYVPDTEMVLGVSRINTSGEAEFQTVRVPLAPGMDPEEIMEAVVQQVMVALPLKDNSAVRNLAVRTCNHQWTRSNLASGPDGFVAQCTRCLRMSDYSTASGTYQLWLAP